MAQNITHTFVSGKADGADATLVRPSNWNAAHTIPAGTAAAPAIVPNSGVVDATSGIWWPAANTVAISTNATEAVRWASDQRMTCAGNVTISGTGPHAFGGATNAAIQFFITGAFPSANNPNAISLQTSLTAGSGGTTEAVILRVSGNTITTAAAAFTLADAAATILSPPTLSLGAGSAITNASTLKISAAPTGATNNYGLWNVGVTRVDAQIIGGTSLQLAALTGNNLLFGRVASVVPGAFTEDMRLTAGILALGTTVTTGALAGDLVLTYGAGSIQFVNSAGNGMVKMVDVRTLNAVTNTGVFGAGASEFAFGHTARTAAAVPGNFTADFYIKLRDNAGSLFYIAGRNASW